MEPYCLTVDELAKITGDLQFRKMTNTGNIVDKLAADKINNKGCFTLKMNSGDLWTNSIALGKDLNTPIDVVHLEFGRDIPHNNVAPAKAVYIWFRVS